MPENPWFVELNRIVNAKRDRVFRAFLEPEAIRAWWAPTGWHTPHVEMNPVVKGEYRFGMHAEGSDEMMFVRGTYTEIEPFDRIGFTYIWEAGGAGERWREFGLIEQETHVWLGFEDLGERTRLSLNHTGFPTQAGSCAHTEGWSSNFDELDDWLFR